MKRATIRKPVLDAAQGSQSQGTEPMTSGLRTVPVSYPTRQCPKVAVPQDLIERARAQAKGPLPKLPEAEAKKYREQMAKLRE